MISVSRNIHMPKVEVSFCCSMSAKWCCSACSATWISLVANGDLLWLMLVVAGLPRIGMIAAGRTHVAENELREERGVESDEHQQRRKFGPCFGIHATGNLGPPEVQPRHVGHHHAADH